MLKKRQGGYPPHLLLTTRNNAAHLLCPHSHPLETAPHFHVLTLHPTLCPRASSLRSPMLVVGWWWSLIKAMTGGAGDAGWVTARGFVNPPPLLATSGQVRDETRWGDTPLPRRKRVFNVTRRVPHSLSRCHTCKSGMYLAVSIIGNVQKTYQPVPIPLGRLSCGGAMVHLVHLVEMIQ